MINNPNGVSNTRFGPSIGWLRNMSMTLLAYAISGFNFPALHNLIKNTTFDDIDRLFDYLCIKYVSNI